MIAMLHVNVPLVVVVDDVVCGPPEGLHRCQWPDFAIQNQHCNL